MSFAEVFLTFHRRSKQNQNNDQNPWVRIEQQRLLLFFSSENEQLKTFFLSFINA